MEKTNSSDKTIFISRETIKRLISDVRDLMNDPLTDEGIYYKHDEEDMLVGYAYLVGPKDSLYYGGNYFFKFKFPSNYPHSPPKVTYITNNGIIRFHPNLYKSGKVCLSILNTWKGEQWSGCQSIRSVLLTLISILDNKPLLHEPGISEKHKDFENYTKIIKFTNLEFSILTILQPEILKSHYNNIYFYYMLFKDDIINNIKNNKPNIVDIIEKNKNKKIEILKTGLYNMEYKIDYKAIYNDKNIIQNI